MYVHTHCPARESPLAHFQHYPLPSASMKNQHNTQGAFGCALTLEQTILLELGRNFNLLALLFCFGFYIYSTLQLLGDPG